MSDFDQFKSKNPIMYFLVNDVMELHAFINWANDRRRSFTCYTRGELPGWDFNVEVILDERLDIIREVKKYKEELV